MLKQGDIVIFRMKDPFGEGLAVWHGSVIFVRDDTVYVSYLEGHRARSDDIPMKDILAIADEIKGTFMEIEPYSGKFVKLND